MKNNTYFNFPTSVVILDDDELFLNSVTRIMRSNFSVIPFSSQKNALNYITSSKNNFLVEQKVLSTLENDEAKVVGNITFQVEKLDVYKAIYNSNRFLFPSVVIVDYNMPGMNGPEFFQAIRNCNAKKIMLTGNKDFKDAISIFNDGLIDKYIVKDSEDLTNELNKEITIQQEAFFRDFSQKFSSQLDKFNLSSNYDNPCVRALMKDIINEREICEYYLVEINKSMVMLDRNKKITWLYIVSLEDITMYADIAAGNEAPEEVTLALENLRKFPILTTNDEIGSSVTRWSDYMYDIKPVPNTNNLFYSIIESNELYSMEHSRITAYADSF